MGPLPAGDTGNRRAGGQGHGYVFRSAGRAVVLDRAHSRLTGRPRSSPVSDPPVPSGRWLRPESASPGRVRDAAGPSGVRHGGGMQFRRAALPLSLLALLAGAGCASVGPGQPAAGPAPGSRPPVGAPDAFPAVPPHRPPPPPLPPPLPLGDLPDAGPAPVSDADAGPGADRAPRGTPGARPPRRGGERATKPAAPRRVHPPAGPRGAVPRRLPGEEPCAAAEGVVPPSVVDLCVRQYGH